MIEPRHKILQAVACGEYQDGSRHLATTLFAEPEETILVRQTEIQEQRIVVDGRDGAVGVRGRTDMIHGEAAVLQRGREIIGKPLIILDEQETHLVPPISAHKRS